MNQYWPFFLTGFFPCFLVLVGMFVNNRDFAQLREQIRDVQSQLNHFIDLHITHAERIATLEQKTKKLP
jgi:hypothetical protein